MSKTKHLAHKSFTELEAACSCGQGASDGEALACEACQVLGAIAAGIPRSVIAGETRLGDHFSHDYIEYKSGKNIKR